MVPVQKVASSSSVRMPVTEADPLGALETPPAATSTGMTKSATCPIEMMDENRTPTPSSRKIDDDILGEWFSRFISLVCCSSMLQNCRAPCRMFCGFQVY